MTSPTAATRFIDEAGVEPHELLSYDEVEALNLHDIDCWHIWTYGDLSGAQLAQLYRLHNPDHHDTSTPQEG